MQLRGSCHCGSVRFVVNSSHPRPYLRCYCSICRKTAGGGGYAVNIEADFSSLNIIGEEHITVYQAKIRDHKTGESKTSPGRRHFCSHCGSALWVWDPRWPELMHPFASAVDSDLPGAPLHTHIMLDSKADWVPVDAGPNDEQFDAYPDKSLSEWHESLGLKSD